ncbi:MAG: hypothetical protein HYW34_03340 [Candidatus Brennerbacteria bacterium]|nr:hypothetical protein [Candidatus Brennerbacteria bacterium]
MFKRFYKIKNIEEFLGMAGLVYLLALLAIAIFLIKLLVAFLFSSMTPSEITKELPPAFDFESR